MAAEYSIVTGKTSAELESEVADAITDGFAPQGGVGIDTRKADPVLYQAMYKSAQE